MATMRRACSYRIEIVPPEDPTTYSAVIVTMAQKKVNLINKTLSDLTIDGNAFIVELTQAETAQFEASVPAWLQMRCFAAAYNAPGSPEFSIEVLPVLDDQILAAPEE